MANCERCPFIQDWKNREKLNKEKADEQMGNLAEYTASLAVFEAEQHVLDDGGELHYVKGRFPPEFEIVLVTSKILLTESLEEAQREVAFLYVEESETAKKHCSTGPQEVKKWRYWGKTVGVRCGSEKGLREIYPPPPKA